jgi:hypothetical protein
VNNRKENGRGGGKRRFPNAAPFPETVRRGKAWRGVGERKNEEWRRGERKRAGGLGGAERAGPRRAGAFHGRFGIWLTRVTKAQ